MAVVKKFRAACKKATPASITAWDYPTALLAGEAGMDLILISDSTGIIALGPDSSVGATRDEIICHARAVARGAKSPFLLGDLPLGSYEKSAEHGVYYTYLCASCCYASLNHSLPSHCNQMCECDKAVK